MVTLVPRQLINIPLHLLLSSSSCYEIYHIGILRGGSNKSRYRGLYYLLISSLSACIKLGWEGTVMFIFYCLFIWRPIVAGDLYFTASCCLVCEQNFSLYHQPFREEFWRPHNDLPLRDLIQVSLKPSWPCMRGSQRMEAKNNCLLSSESPFYLVQRQEFAVFVCLMNQCIYFDDYIEFIVWLLLTLLMVFYILYH